jgi:phenylacetate-CoA ligase
LKYASKNVPYYSSLFRRKGFDPDIRNLSSVAEVPVLSRFAVQQNRNQLLTARPEGLKISPKSTGGSTGEPVRFFVTRRFRDYGAADIMRHYHWTGWNLGEKQAFVWGAERDSPLATRRGKLHSRILRHKWLNSFHLTSEKMREFADSLQKFKPTILVGYATSLCTFATFLNEEGIELPPLRGVQSSAEKLYDKQRLTITKQFNCPVFDRYGCREVGNIAHECSEHSGLHVSQELMYLEIIKDGEQAAIGEEGDVVVTSFTNLAFPFIRYRVGDRGTLLDPDEGCNCGRNLVKMSTTVGRTTDNFRFENGLIVHGEFFTHLFYNVAGVKQFQIVQKSLSKLLIRIVPISTPENIALEEVAGEIQKWIGLPIEIDVEFLDTIEPSPTGKHRFTISEVEHM